MSQENVEVVRQVFEARNQGDWETVRAYAAPDIEFDLSRLAGDWTGVYRGVEAIGQLVEETSDAWSDIRWEAEEFIDAGDAVVVRVRFFAVGRATGIETVSRGGQVYWLADGKVVRYVQYPDPADALEAAGRRE